MADVASLLAEFQKGIEGKDTGLGATVKFDFEGAGCIFLDGKSNPNTVSDEDKDADCTLSMSLETFEQMRSGEVDGTSAFMQGKLESIWRYVNCNEVAISNGCTCLKYKIRFKKKPSHF